MLKVMTVGKPTQVPMIKMENVSTGGTVIGSSLRNTTAEKKLVMLPKSKLPSIV